MSPLAVALSLTAGVGFATGFVLLPFTAADSGRVPLLAARITSAVLGSLFPIVVIVLARVFLGERLRWLQRGGVALALVAVVLTALP